MSSSGSRFLLDENVRFELDAWLRRQGADAVRGEKGVSDKALAGRSRRESRVVVTNDGDFAQYGANDVFGVVWLRIPQNDPDGLIKAFDPLFSWLPSRFKGKLIILSLEGAEVVPLAEDLPK